MEVGPANQIATFEILKASGEQCETTGGITDKVYIAANTNFNVFRNGAIFGNHGVNNFLLYRIERLKDLQQREIMHMAWSLFSERMYERIQMTKMLPKQVVADTTQTKTRSTMLASRFSNEEMPSVLGLQLRT